MPLRAKSRGMTNSQLCFSFLALNLKNKTEGFTTHCFELFSTIVIIVSFDMRSARSLDQSPSQWTFLAHILTNIIKPKHAWTRRRWQTGTQFVSPAASGMVLFSFNRSQTSWTFCIHFAKLCADDCFKQLHFIITDDLHEAIKKLWTAGALRHNNKTYSCCRGYIDNCPKRCNTKQSIYYSASSLYMFRVSTTPIISSTQNCNYSLR